MSEWHDNQKKQIGNFRKLRQKRIAKANPRSTLTAKEYRRLSKIEVIADKLKHGENVQSSDGVTHYLNTNDHEVVNV